jgi:hypothetical protein
VAHRFADLRARTGREVGLLLGRQALLFQSGLGRGEGVGGRGSIAAAAALVEVDRRGVQLQQQGDGFGRARGMAVILLRQLLEAEFVSSGRFPQKVGVELLRQRLGFGHHLGGRRGGKAQQDAGALDLAALAGRGFDLRGGLGLGQQGAGPEVAVLFENQVHQKSRMVGRSSRKRV